MAYSKFTLSEIIGKFDLKEGNEPEILGILQKIVENSRLNQTITKL
jgi:hypothetical protein